MFVIDEVRNGLDELERMSWLIHLGLSVMAVAFAAAIILQPSPSVHEHAGHAADQHLAHLVALLGMALVLAGVALDARRHAARRQISRASQGGTTHAHR